MINNILRECGRCHRLEYAADAQIDMMPQPDGQPCGGVFMYSGAARRENEVQRQLRRGMQRELRRVWDNSKTVAP